MYKQQQEEIKTIRPRTIEVNLSDADVKRISEKAGKHGLTVGELIGNFIGDLVDGTYSNGSDERMYANEWFDRCWFGAFPDYTFLKYLLEWGRLEEVIKALENIETSKETIAEIEESLKTSNDKEWEENEKEILQDEQNYIARLKETIDDYWQEYTAEKKEYKNGTLEEEMKTVLDYWNRYKYFLGKK